MIDTFTSLVRRRSSDVLVVSREQRVTIGEIDSLSRGVAESIDAALIPPGTLIGLAVSYGPAFLAGFLGLLRAKQTVVLLDPVAPMDEQRRAVETVGAIAVLSCMHAWPGSAADFHVSLTGVAEVRHAGPDVVVVKLTSGSTGLPRGVAMTENNLLADEAALASTMGFRAADRLLSALPLSHSYGFTTLALSAVLRGLTLVLPSDEGPFAPLTAARELGATIFPTVPAYFQALLKMSQPPAWPEGLGLVISAGAVLSSATAIQFRETFGQPVHAFYGSSECGGICYDRDGGAAERGTVGSPVDGVRVSLSPLNEPEGRVVVESAAVAATYWPVSDARLGSGRFETSDVASWSGDELALQRRVDRVINLRGRKVDPLEIEQVLAALDGVNEAVVLGVKSPRGEDVIRAVVACAAGRLDYLRVTAWCRHRLADHKIPRSVILVDTIPRTPRGKIDRAALLEMSARDDSNVARG